MIKGRAPIAKLLNDAAGFSSLEPVSLKAARAYCRKLAKSHYENFMVASFLLPRRLKRHFYNIYAYCRISDDLGDEAGDSKMALQLLEQWQNQLQACYLGQSRHPVFIALRETIEAFDIPMTPFADLLEAFKQDQTKTRYATFEQLLQYCRYSANPVGHLVLYLCGYRDQERQRLSDLTCTALQLANHWQDIGRDLLHLDRIYLPTEDMQKFYYGEADLRAQIADERFVGLMQWEVARTREMFDQGLKLSEMVDSRLSLDIELFGRCGLEVLRRIEAVGYDVFRQRPTLSQWDQMKIFAETWWKRRRSSGH